MPEWLHLSLALGFVLVLFASCVCVPALLAKGLGVWFGLLGAIAAVVVWGLLVNPMPGLIQGVVCLSGLFALVGAVCMWIAIVNKHYHPPIAAPNCGPATQLGNSKATGGPPSVS